MNKREGWNDNEASQEERQEPNFLFDLNADFCDRHEMGFPMGRRCPKCIAADSSGGQS